VSDRQVKGRTAGKRRGKERKEGSVLTKKGWWWWWWWWLWRHCILKCRYCSNKRYISSHPPWDRWLRRMWILLFDPLFTAEMEKGYGKETKKREGKGRSPLVWSPLYKIIQPLLETNSYIGCNSHQWWEWEVTSMSSCKRVELVSQWAQADWRSAARPRRTAWSTATLCC